jgi:enamine deaminase RidA (YjgF/YER057c/UK114 family)
MPYTGKVTTLSTGKQLYTTPAPYELALGYHRAVRKGPFIFVSGSTALLPTPKTDSSDRPTYVLQHPGDAYAQTIAAFGESLRAVEALGGTKADVVRIRMYAARHADAGGVTRAMSEVFGTQRERKEGEGEGGVAVAATLLVLGHEGGGGFIDKDMLVEVEVDAVVG